MIQEKRVESSKLNDAKNKTNTTIQQQQQNGDVKSKWPGTLITSHSIDLMQI